MRETRLLDGADWRFKGYLGLDGALRAAARPHDAGDGWLPAAVPGTVLDDLWRAGEVADPYRERNSLLAEWVPERAWTFRRRLEGVAAGEARSPVLRFEGVDHACHVFLDGEAIGRHEGMFVPFEIDLRERLGPGDHELGVVIEPGPPNEPQVGRTSRVRIHKSRMVYGWDFCPRLVHQGIWRSVALELREPVGIRDVWVRPELSADLREGRLEVRVGLEAGRGTSVHVTAELRGRTTARVEVDGEAAAGRSELRLDLSVDTPALWWPNGLGEPVVHRVVVSVSGPDGPLDEREVPLGFRRLELRPNKAAPDARPYTFVVNGRPIYANGWNWVPLDALYGVPRPERLAHLLRLAANANVNLLRVWGGGLIESESFYDACDRLGILVWQEFSQSSSGVESEPASDRAFVELMTREAEAVVPLRRNHPSLAAWCGGNELEDAAGPLDEARSPVLAALRGVVRRLDPGRAWLPTSPSGPRFHNRLDVIADDPDALHDVHGPWEHQGLHGQYALYDRGTSLFNSEFGVEGMTNRRTHEALISPDHRWPATRANPVYRHLGDWWLNEPLVQEAFGGRLTDLESLRRASQFLQAEGLRYAVEANRRRWPRNSGSIPWQFNESYPNAWCTAAVDHRGDPKPAYFAVRRAYAPTVVCASFDRAALGGSPVLPVQLWAWAVGPMVGCTVQARLLGVDGAPLAKWRVGTELVDGRPVRIGEPRRLAIDDPPPLFFLDLRLENAAGAAAARNRYLFSGSSDFGALLDVAPARLDVDLHRGGDDAWRLEICHRSGPAAIGLRAEDDRPIGSPGWAEADDGGFDLLPGERRSVTVRWAGAPANDRRLRLSAWNVEPLVVDA
jgi:beta-mannosidase